jgi:hypothetical protein
MTVMLMVSILVMMATQQLAGFPAFPILLDFLK